MLFNKENKKASNILRYIVKAGDYLGYTVIGLPVMILFIPLVDIFLRFIHPSPWFFLPVLIAITILVFRLNKSQKLIVFASLFVFYAVIWFSPPMFDRISRINYLAYLMRGLFYTKWANHVEYNNYMDSFENLLILMLFLPITIGFCYLSRKTRSGVTF